MSIRYVTLVSGSLRQKVVVEGQAATGCVNQPMRSSVHSHDCGHLKRHVEQAATGLRPGSLSTSFLRNSMGDDNFWRLFQNAYGIGRGVCWS